MPDLTLQKLKDAFEALHKSRTIPSIRKIAKTAAQFIKRAINKSESEIPRITMPPKNPPCIQVEDPFVKHERDAFRMKAFSLLNSKAYSYSVSQKLDWLQNAPIKRIVNSESKEISFFQVLQPFPGERIELKGTFKRHLQRAEHTAPVAGSFQVDMKSHVTGFPHASQHTGWALTAAHLNASPLLEQVQLMLEPESDARENAQLWTESKKIAFNQNAALFLQMHQQLAEALNGNEDERISNFHEWMRTQEDPFEVLCSVHSFEVFDDSVVTEYQDLLSQYTVPSPHLVLCAESQLKSFLATLNEKPPSINGVTELLKELINSDLATIELIKS